MNTQWKLIVSRLKKPSVILSLVSQIASVPIVFGLNVDKNIIITVAAILCNVLVTLGILSNPDTETKGYGDDVFVCTGCGQEQPHVIVNGQLVCKNCGTVYNGENSGISN